MDRRTTFSKFIIEDRSRQTGPDAELTALLNDIQTACKFITSAVSRGALGTQSGRALHDAADEIMRRETAWGGQICSIVSDSGDVPEPLPAGVVRGPYLLVFDPLDGANELDVNMPVGTIFSVLRAPDGVREPVAADFLQPGTEQLAAGYVLYGPTSMMVMTLGAGVHGFTLDREIGAYTLTHPDMRIPENVKSLAINAPNRRFWEEPVRYYVEECLQGEDGARGNNFVVRWVDSLVSEVHRVLLRGGVFLNPRDTSNASMPTNLHYLYEASPMAWLVEQAGGAASTGRGRVVEVAPKTLLERVPLILGSRAEVERIAGYHAAYDRGEELGFEAPLFNARSLFRTG